MSAEDCVCVPEGVVLAADRSLGTSFTLSQTTALPDLAFCYPRALSLPTLLPNTAHPKSNGCIWP